MLLLRLNAAKILQHCFFKGKIMTCIHANMIQTNNLSKNKYEAAITEIPSTF